MTNIPSDRAKSHLVRTDEGHAGVSALHGITSDLDALALDRVLHAGDVRRDLVFTLAVLNPGQNE